ncbi:hypothetical protein B0E45_27950 [Sinorhizobium sp. A49]|nr:hypothetical protein B0E45_27950 [Sinorhizobium sp. A49]
MRGAEHRTLDSPIETIIRSLGKEGIPCFAANITSLTAASWQKSPGMICVSQLPSKQRPKRRRKPSDVSGPPLSPRFGRGQEPSRRIARFPPPPDEERQKRELRSWVSRLQSQALPAMSAGRC